MPKKIQKKTKTPNLKDLLIQKLQALYDIEQELVKALPKLAKAATDSELKKAFSDHLKETKNHAKRLEEAFGILGIRPKKLKCEGIRGIAEDAAWVIKNVKGEEALDTNLAAAARYAEHYEMAGYLAAKGWAEALDESYIEELLTSTLEEEENADEALEEISKTLSEELLSRVSN